MKRLWKDHGEVVTSAAMGFAVMSGVMFAEWFTPGFLPWNI